MEKIKEIFNFDNIGGKIKGFFNPKWKARKERQADRFANAAANSLSKTKDGEMFYNDYGGYTDLEGNIYSNRLNSLSTRYKPSNDKDDMPYKIQHNNFTYDRQGNNHHYHKGHGDIYNTSYDVNDRENLRALAGDNYDKRSDINTQMAQTSMLNNRYRDGSRAVKNNGGTGIAGARKREQDYLNRRNKK